MKKKLTNYTMQKHAARVLSILSHKNPCAKCPAGKKFYTSFSLFTGWLNSPCLVCREFSSIKISIANKLKRFGIIGNPSGGYNNRINKTGLFYHKPKNFPRRYFVAGDVLKRSDTEYIYRSFRCTKCNKKLAPQEQWLSHNDCTRLIRKHLKNGDCC